MKLVRQTGKYWPLAWYCVWYVEMEKQDREGTPAQRFVFLVSVCHLRSSFDIFQGDLQFNG